jgi:hypothetical protein
MKRRGRLIEWVLVLAAASLTAIWLSLWANWLVRLAMSGDGLPIYWTGLLALAGATGAAVTRVALARPGWTRRQSRAFVSTAGVVVVLVLVWLALDTPRLGANWGGGPHLLALLAPAGPGFLAGCYIWWHGIHLGRDAISHHTFSGAFSGGLLALGLLVAANAIAPALPTGELLAASLLFFTLGLGGLALGSLRRLSASQRAALAQVALQRDWLITAAVVIGLVLAAGLALASLVAPDTFQRLAESFDTIANGVGTVLALLIAPFALAAMALMQPWMGGLARLLLSALEVLRGVLLRLSSLVGVILQLLSVRAPINAVVQRLEAFIASPAVQGTGRWASFVGVLLLLAVVFWLAARRLGVFRTLDEDEQRDSILSGELLWAQLRQLFRRRPAASRALSPYLDLSGSSDDARLRVRRAYQAMLEWARTIRLPRAAGQTPGSYARLLSGAVPEAHDAIEILTTAYMQARYAAEAPAPEVARSAEGAAARLTELHARPTGQL